MELGLRWSGLRGGTFPFGEEVALFRCPRVRAGEYGCGDEGSAVDEAVLIESRSSECESELFVDGGNGGDSIVSFTMLFCDE